jgi:hypothetical protein
MGLAALFDRLEFVLLLTGACLACLVVIMNESL